MPHMWVLLFVVGSALGSSGATIIAGFGSLEACEHSRTQLVAKMSVRKSACIEVIGPEPITPPVDHDH